MSDRFDRPYYHSPTNFPEEKRLLCRMYRLVRLLEALEEFYGPVDRRIANDMGGAHYMVEQLLVTIECQMYLPRRNRYWVDQDALRKLPPPRIPLLKRFLSVCRRAAKAVIQAHDSAVWEFEQQKGCSCVLCFDIYHCRWVLGQMRKLLSVQTKEGRS